MFDSIDLIVIELRVASKPALFVLVAADGTVHRLGTGTVNNTERDLFIGRSADRVLDQLRAGIRPEWLDHQGSYDAPDKKGLPCELVVLMRHSDASESGLRFLYGSKSQGPPREICDFVERAVSITEPWYQEQKRRAARSKVGRKPWWKFW